MANVYVIKDVVADVICAGPFIAVNDGVMIRSIMELLNNERNPQSAPYRSNPSDYELWSVGSMDDKTGVLIPLKSSVMMHRLSALYTPISNDK